LKDSPEEIHKYLSTLLEGEVLVDRLTRLLYSTDASIYEIEPKAVVLPRTVEDVLRVVKFAGEEGVPVFARGGGSGLAGESLGPGIVLDFSKYMNHILEVNETENFVRCGPGVVLSVLNAALARRGKVFGPDPASGSRCTLGGMLGNNAAGVHSVYYGVTRDQVLALEAALPDGSLHSFSREKRERAKGEPKDDFHRALVDPLVGLLQDSQPLIEEKVPRTRRNTCGYLLDGVLRNGEIDLTRLLVGSEGTLALITQAKLSIYDLPQARALVLLHFDDLDKAARAVPLLLSLEPCAVELMDRWVIKATRQAFPEYAPLLPGDLVALLLVEFAGESADDVEGRAEEAKKITESARLASGASMALDAASQDRLWQMRKSVTPALVRLPGDKKAIPFIEDTAVAPEQLAEYIQGQKKIIDTYGLEAAIFSHAGDGLCHTRPLVDLRSSEDVEKMPKIANEVYNLCLSLGGSISGEHGDGLSRSQFIPRQYGALYDVMCKVKDIFDPQNIFNPGKIITRGQDIMTRDLRRLPPVDVPYRESRLLFSAGEYARELANCNGCALCRSPLPEVTMCPMFKALAEEGASSRGKCNLLRYGLIAALDEEKWADSEFQETFDKCLACGMCTVDCPSGVNVMKLVLDMRARLAEERGLSRSSRALITFETLSRLCSWFAPMVNYFSAQPMLRFMLEKTAGLDRTCELPRFSRNKLKKHLKNESAGSHHKVAYFADTFASCSDPEIARALVSSLGKNNIEVVLPKQKGAGMPALAYGSLNRARRRARYNIRHLAPLTRAGRPIIATEPTAAFCLKEAYKFLQDGEDAELVADNTYEAFQYLRRLNERGEFNIDFQEVNRKVAYHAPCHLKALQIGRPALEILRLVPGLEIMEIDEGCCGMAGTFGLKKENREVSLKIGKRLFEAVKNSGAELVASECSTCRLQIEEATGIKTVHPIMLLRGAYGD
jgi:anaerobic glycerol-3-phosphate dehydrogenase C subunit